MIEFPAIGNADYRWVLGHYPTGVCVITARDAGGGTTGMAVSSFTSASLDPPLVAFFPGKGSSTWPRIAAVGQFCVNILAADQQEICRRFASKAEDRFDGVDHHISAHGTPVLADVVASIECKVENVFETGDHYMVLGRILSLVADGSRPPLLFFQSGYGEFQPQTIFEA